MLRSIVPVSGPGHVMDVDGGGAQEGQAQAPVSLFEAALVEAEKAGLLPPHLRSLLPPHLGR